ncbi:structural constituent of cell wall [Rhizoctonia solani AG-1 IB]|uniref:Structural constituent of cell wall n=1 Tax=Thanatephorus cucumeris (strain AG1-IB / isolate 7/3/14) TaxID=1108050 RepID=A0A0B7F590_THACB|nr:structural constituent of cell wall [Rhizoctonia solani AG-1 IB]
MPPRKKTRGALKRLSSDSAGEDNVNTKRPRADVEGDATSHTSLDAAPRPRKQITYKSKARQKAGLGVASPPKLTNFGFNVENKPKHGRALFHLSPSPRAKAKRSKVFASPKARRRKSKGGANTSTDASRIEVTLDDDSEEDGAEPNNSTGTLVEHDEFDDQPAPLPTLPAIRPITGPGLEIRTPLQGRVVPTLQSLSKRPHATPVPLFAATPRHLHTQLPPVADNETDAPLSPSKLHSVPIFAPTPSRALAVPSTPAYKSRTMPIFTPSVRRTEGESPAKKPPPMFAPTENPFASVTTPAPSNAVTAPPKLPLFSSALPATVIPETPTTKGRSLPTFTPKMLFPPPIAEETEEKPLTSGASKPAVFGGVLEDENESTPRVNRQVVQLREQDAPPEKEETEQTEVVGPNQSVATLVEEGPADVSMADLFNDTMVQFTPRSARVLGGKQGSFVSSDSELERIESSQPDERTRVSQSIEHTGSSESVPETKPSPLPSDRVTRSRSRSESASALDPAVRGPVGPSREGSAVPSRAGSQAPQTRSVSRGPSPTAENEPTAPKSRRGSTSSQKRSRSASVAIEIPAPPTATSRSASSLGPLVTDQPTLFALKSRLQSRTNSMDEHRTSQTAAIMMDTPREEDVPSAFPNPDPMDPETSPLSSVPDDMSFSFINGGNTTAGDTTMRDAGDTTVCPDQNGDTTMRLRGSAESLNSSPASPPAPTSPVSSLPASPEKRPQLSSSPTRPEGNTEANDVLVPVSDAVIPTSFPSTRTRSSSLTSMSELTDLSDDEGHLEVVEPAPTGAETESKKSMIPLPKRPGTPGPPPRPPTPGKAKTPFGARAGLAPANGMTPGPSRSGIPVGLASAKKSGIPTPGPANKAALAIGSITPGPSTSAAALGLGKPTAASRSNLPARTRSGATKARSLAAPTASTAAKTRTKVVTAPPPPRSRITSFMKPNSAVNRPPVSSSSAIAPPSAPIGTNPSPRKGQSKDDSDLPGSRRSMISKDTQASLSSLSSALERLARPSLLGSRPGLPPRPGTSMGFVPPQRPGSSLGFSEKRTKENGPRSSTGSETSKLVAKPASTSTIKGKAKAKDEGSDDGVYEGSDEDDKTKADPNGPLRTCVAFVDVRTAAGENSGGAFAHMLKKLGAKIVSRPTPSTTHIIFKSGHQSTLTKYKLYDDPKPFLVGIAWVVQCAEKLARVDEEGFRVKTDEVSALDLKRRRKAELPHQMQFMARDPNPSGPKFGSMSAEASAVSKSLEASADEVMQDAERAAERGKQRVQQKLVPRVRDRSPS